MPSNKKGNWRKYCKRKKKRKNLYIGSNKMWFFVWWKIMMAKVCRKEKKKKLTRLLDFLYDFLFCFSVPWVFGFLQELLASSYLTCYSLCGVLIKGKGQQGKITKINELLQYISFTTLKKKPKKNNISYFNHVEPISLSIPIPPPYLTWDRKREKPFKEICSATQQLTKKNKNRALMFPRTKSIK